MKNIKTKCKKQGLTIADISSPPEDSSLQKPSEISGKVTFAVISFKFGALILFPELFFSTGCTDLTNSVLQEAIACLKHENEGVPKLLDCWSKTHALRRLALTKTRAPNDTETCSTTAYIKEWAALALPNGFLLVSHIVHPVL